MKKTMKFIMVAMMLFSVMAILNLSVFAAGDTFATATVISTDFNYSGVISETNTKDMYKFTIPSSGRINIKLNAYINETDYYLYDAEGNMIWSNTYCYWNDVSEVFSMDANIDLTKGTYYFAVQEHSGTGDYNFKITFKSAGESFSETLNGDNQSIKTADAINLNTTYKGQIALNDSKDVYKFTIPSSGRTNIKLNAYIYETDYYLYDAEGNMIWSNTYCYWNDVSEVFSMNANIDLTKGTYYFAVQEHSGTGDYNFKITCKSAGESFVETLNGNNQDMKTADAINLNTTYKGQIAHNDGKDVYKFTIPASGKINIKLNAYIYGTDYYLYDAAGNKIWESTYNYWNNVSEVFSMDTNIDLTKGTYYFGIQEHNGTGNYNFSIKFAAPVIKSLTNTASGVKVTWGSVSSAKSYIVYRKTYNATTKKWGGWTNLGNTTATSFVDKTAKSGTYYIYTVKAAIGTIYSAYNTTGLKTYFLSTPKVASTANSNSAITVKWGKVAGATGYVVYRKTTGGWVNLGKTTGTSFVDKTAKSGVTYRYTVKAYYGSYVSSFNTKGYAIRRLLTPALSKVASTTSGVKFTWGKVAGASGYIVYRRTYNATTKTWGGWTNLGKTTAASFVDKSAKKGTYYVYTTKAYYGSSTSAYNTTGLKVKDVY